MKAVEKKEGAKIEIAPPKEEVKKEAPYVKQEIPGLFSDTDKNTAKDEPRVKDENKVPVVNNTNTKKIEIGINDKYRILNELFDQQQIEFNVVIEQLNVTENWEEAEIYLGSLLEIYGWKVDNELVKTLYSLVQKRFI
ncbi:MAG TPA: hypothetical protein VNX68_17255 [Nitrosopumilaceae archaeon]|nr:hypothetical protein [Nitrosopumilaceae archaeon]